jgi:pyruvate formate lyase activating enzyme
MKGIIFDIKRFAVHDGPGIRTTVFFKGCPLSCPWCHNPEGIDRNPFKSVKRIMLDGETYEQPEMVGRSFTVNEAMKMIIRDRVFFEESDGGVTFSGGEPLLQPEFLHSLLTTCHLEGLHTAIDTCGQVQQDALETILPYTDLFLFDFKHHDPVKLETFTGASHKLITNNLEYILKMGKTVHIRIPVIPSFNNKENDMMQMMSALKSMPGQIRQVDLLPYHSLGRNKYRRFGMINTMENTPEFNKDEIQSAYQIFKRAGFQVTIGG